MTRSLPDDIIEPLEGLGSLEVWEGEGPIPRDRLLTGVAGARGVLTMLTDVIDAEVLAAATHLVVVSQMAVGVDNIDVDACRRRGIRVGHTPGVLTETVADTAFALMAALVRRIPEGETAVREGRWGTWSPFWLAGGDLHARTLGVIGMGRVGRALALRASGFDMRVIYSSPREAEDLSARRVGLDTLLSAADVVVLAARLTEETRGMIGRRELGLMGRGSYLVNVARGPMVVTDDLVDALSRGRIAGAALDVTDPEPLPPDHALLGLANCLVTPHIASASIETRRAMARLAVDNLVAGVHGAAMPAEFALG